MISNVITQDGPATASTPHDARQPQPVAPSLLARVRAETRALHDQVDEAFQPLIAGQTRDLPGFLRAQAVALAALSGPDGAELPGVAALTRELLADLQADLAPVMGSDGAKDRPSARVAPLDPLAVAYIVVGSRLGTIVIARRLAEDGVAPLPRYFRPRDTRLLWQAVGTALSAAPASGQAADRITADVATGFRIFLAAARPVGPETAGMRP